MSESTFYAGPLDERSPDKKHWLRSDKRSLLELPVGRDIVRARLFNALRSDVTDNKGWILPRVKFHGQISGDVLNLICTRYGRPSTNYYITGHLLAEANGGSQITLHIVDDLRLRILMTPFFAFVPVLFGAYSLGLRGWLLAGAVILGGCIWATFGTTLVYVVALRQRDTALEDVRRFLTQAVLQVPSVAGPR